MVSSAQISSGVCRCGSQEQVPVEGSRRFRRVPGCAGVGSGGRFGKVPEGSGVCRCRFRRQVPEGSGGFRSVLVQVPEAGSGRFGVPDATSGRFRKVPESLVCYVATQTGAAIARRKAIAVGDTAKAYLNSTNMTINGKAAFGHSCKGVADISRG